ncbi:ubiquinol-cytochrome C chaperone family protein [Sphingosinicella rhizophila]|uniref:Ubiquinol-cytochrome C chaperone family protein n=1 Tax=Sphingosinicella rhizophila TaxID=3050082 RepID=A0ABU3Q801_9SPHN|nr:ubiquinol-cytochrome C chaperone family protein [Sphingosinicella sp. GR2756]MDT9599506.1 ubiquinol-cytochrome C chaperone family protein [Sphingosinicella sp. GR2756]
MSFITRIFGDRRERDRLAPLYGAIVAAARDPRWYREGQVPDTIDGRFDMVAAVLALVLIRLEREGDRCRDDSVLLTETFVADMDGTLRQIGIGDFVVGKHVGRMMGALGGRLSAFRDGGADEGALEGAVGRNIFRESPPSPEALRTVSVRLRQFQVALDALPADRIVAGQLPTP